MLKTTFLSIITFDFPGLDAMTLIIVNFHKSCIFCTMNVHVLCTTTWYVKMVFTICCNNFNSNYYKNSPPANSLNPPSMLKGFCVQCLHSVLCNAYYFSVNLYVCRWVKWMSANAYCLRFLSPVGIMDLTSLFDATINIVQSIFYSCDVG